eukprot:3933183-Pleurochrysis_carterae.AAC.1
MLLTPDAHSAQRASRLSATPVRWKRDPWEGPRYTWRAKGFGGAGAGGSAFVGWPGGGSRLRLKLKRNWYPTDHALASWDPLPTSSDAPNSSEVACEMSTGREVEREVSAALLSQKLRGAIKTEHAFELESEDETVDDCMPSPTMQRAEGG